MTALRSIARTAFAIALLATGCRSSDLPPARRMPAARQVLAAHAQDGESPVRLARALLALRKSPRIEHAGAFPMRFLRADGTEPSHTVHPQGLAWIASTREWAISAVEIVVARGRPGSDPQPNGSGRGFLFFADAGGRIERAKTVELATAADEAFHPGGVDTRADGIWVPVSPYYPRSSARIVRIDASRPRATRPVFELDDHIGVVAAAEHALFAASWDARTLYALAPATGAVLWRAPSRTWLAAQDGQALAGTPYVVWAGPEAGDRGSFGLDVLRAGAGGALTLVRSIRWRTALHLTPSGRTPFQNGVHLWVDRRGTLWALVAPDDQHGRYARRPHGTPPSAPDVPDPAHGTPTALHLYRID